MDEDGSVKRFRLLKNSRSGKERSYRFEEIDAVRTTVASKSEKKAKGGKKGQDSVKQTKKAA